MKMLRLDHVNIRTDNLAAMTSFYETVLGLRSGDRPNFPFPGAWIYLDGQPIIHLVEVKGGCAAVEPRIEHFAIQATGLKELTGRLTELGIDFSVDPVPDLPIVQVNLADVDGNHIHIDFDAAEMD